MGWICTTQILRNISYRQRYDLYDIYIYMIYVTYIILDRDLSDV